MIYLVDNSFDGAGTSASEIAAALRRIAPEMAIVIERYMAVTPARVAELAPTHVVLSGQSHPWPRYAPEALAGVFAVIREARQPILGICGGHQQIALCHGAEVGVMTRVAPGDGYDGAVKTRGFRDVDPDGAGMFAGLSRFGAWASHFDEVKQLPPGFVRTATSDYCAIQAMRHAELPVYGVQFHPELFDDEHPHGRRVLAEFVQPNT